MRAFVLGIVATLVLLGIVLLIASRMKGQEITIQPDMPPLATRALRVVPLAYLTPEAMLPYKHYLPVVYGTGDVPAVRRVRKALNLVGGVSCDELYDLDTQWVYNWGPYTGEKCPGIPWVPMVRDRNQLDTTAHTLIGYEGPILGFNEPENQDCAAGACMSLEELIVAWHDLEELLPGAMLASPAFLYPYGLGYDIHDFVNGYRAEYGVWPDFKIIAVHYYAPNYYPMQQVKDWFEYMWSRIEALPDVYDDLPVWITETGVHTPNGLDPVAIAFGAEFLQWELGYLEATGRVEYINWFGPRQGTYTFCVPLYSGGNLTAVGQIWRGW